MAYTQQINRQNKACFLFLLDQSYSMVEPLGNSTDQKCDELGKAMNAWLQNMMIRSTGDEGLKDYMDIGVIGYRTDDSANPIIETAFQGELRERLLKDGRTLIPIAEIAPAARRQNLMQSVPDEDTGELLQVPAEVLVWVDPMAQGGTPMCHTLHFAYGVLEKWIAEHPKSYPPIVINITDGESQDGDPGPYAEAIRSLATEDGNVLLFSCHLSATAADSFMFPSSDEILPDKLARDLFRMSSVLPEPIYRTAVAENFALQPNARGMVFNADMVCLIKFLDMGTRVAKNLR
jgi:hypothetical protein